MLSPYFPEPLTFFSVDENEHDFLLALKKVKNDLGHTYPMVIDNKKIATSQTFASVNPARPEEVIGRFAMGDASHADSAIAAATRAFDEWRRVPVEERARYLMRAAAEMRRRKHEFSAMMVFEVGKSWAEADADTAEAIDFLEYYARQMLRIADSSNMLTQYPPELLQLKYIPLGVGAVITPWNFPLAIATGMVSSALVAGNTVVFKPAEQSPYVAYKMCELFWNNGLPAGVLNYLTGDGAVVGGRMVEHPQTRFISFTGSKDVGVSIYEKGAKVQSGQKWLKRMILEMGGKDGIIVDETANLDEAAKGIVASAFGFQGQKCSACSRAVIVDSVYEEVTKRVVQYTGELVMGATDSSWKVNMGPVIDQEAVDKITSYINIGAGEGKLLIGGKLQETTENGYFIQPTVFGDVAPRARIAQEEIFGPVLAMVRAKDFADAMNIINDTDYGLTGAVYSNNRYRLEEARKEFHVGNLYLNRKSTGAIVGVHPFGGFNLSGTDSKAGGPDYLLHFTQAKSIAEKL